MIHIFFDIENTIIDDLWNCNFLQDSCDRITRWLHSRFSFVPRGRLKCYLFTWGWKERSEIEQKIVKKLFDRLEIPEANRGFVWTKDDSIQCAIKHEWVNTSDEVEIEDLHIPGAMKRFGLEKQTCFVQQAKDLVDFKNTTCATANADIFFLIDDTNNEEEIESRTFTNKHNFNIEVRFLHSENLDV